MKISRAWLQTYFENPLPDTQVLCDALTFHAFEIDGVERVGSDDVLDVKITANRGHDCLSHRGIAKELAAILKLPLTHDLLSSTPPQSSGADIVTNIDFARAPVGAVAYMRGVSVGPSPQWLKERLEAVGQRSINAVVDATNYVMFDIGCPTHAFDATRFKDGESVHYGIRASKKGETLSLLGGATIELSGDEAVIMDAHGEAVDLGGVKGGRPAELSDTTTELVLSASKFNPIQTRKAAQRFNQRTEAAKRFENEFAADLSAYGIAAVAQLVQEIAGGEIVGIAIARGETHTNAPVSVTLSQINGVLGISLTAEEVLDVFKRLNLTCVYEGDTFTVTAPFERLDITIAEDLIEEVGRIIGYDRVPATPLPPANTSPSINTNFYRNEAIRAWLTERGFSEVFTSVFAEKGERVIANKIDGVRPYLRTNLTDGLTAALDKNIHNKDLLGIEQVKIFEIGTVWREGGEMIEYDIAVEKKKKAPTQEEYKKELDAFVASLPHAPLAYQSLPLSNAERYQAFSKYPFIVRDIAMWVDANTDASKVIALIREHAGELLVRSELFDRFEKDARVSLAFRLIFQSFERTLTDEEVNVIMRKIAALLTENGYEIR